MKYRKPYWEARQGDDRDEVNENEEDAEDGSVGRSAFQRDKARILHSNAFRRLQAKAQVLRVGESDIYRTRLTHSVEVASIGAGIYASLRNCSPSRDMKDFTDKEKKLLKKLLKDQNLIESIGLAHDIGHPPFGHSGESALNYMMREYGGFEGNAQTTRIVTKLEKYHKKYGLDLTRRTLLGLIKYPALYSNVSRTELQECDSVKNRCVNCADHKPPKCSFYDSENDVFQFIMEGLSGSDQNNFRYFPQPSENEKHGKTVHKSFDCSIMDIADEIAYGVYDLEDAARYEIIKVEDLSGLCDDFKNLGHFEGVLREALKERGECIDKEETPFQKLYRLFFFESEEGDRDEVDHYRQKATSILINSLVKSTVIYRQDAFEEPLLKYRVKLHEEAKKFLDILAEFVHEKVVKRAMIQTLDYHGGLLNQRLFEALCSSPEDLLPQKFKQRYEKAETEKQKKRVVCDYIAGMSDNHAKRLYARLYESHSGNIKDFI